MKWRCWKMGLLVAGVTGLLTGVLGLGLNMTWKAALLMLAVTTAKDLLLYLVDHPAEAAMQDSPAPSPQSLVHGP